MYGDKTIYTLMCVMSLFHNIVIVVIPHISLRIKIYRVQWDSSLSGTIDLECHVFFQSLVIGMFLPFFFAEQKSS